MYAKYAHVLTFVIVFSTNISTFKTCCFTACRQTFVINFQVRTGFIIVTWSQKKEEILKKRIKIKLIEGNAKRCHLKNRPVKEICGRCLSV
jgi:hypothetical protein